MKFSDALPEFPEDEATQLLGMAENLFSEILPPGMLPEGFPAIAVAITMILTRIESGESDSCNCGICSDLKVIVSSARDMT